MSTIIDEIKKKIDLVYKGEGLNDPPTEMVDLSDIEETLARCTCENCKHWNMKNLECKNDIIFINHKSFANISDRQTNLDFGCIRWQSKEEKEG